ncbi:MAG: PIN domain-containing protein [Oscillospiraceae bacterium]
MKNLFIDSNIWLSLFSFTSDDLTQFEKLKDLIGTDLRLFIPQQVQNEVNRNREAKIKESLKTFEIKPIQYPVFCKGYAEYISFSSDYSTIIHRHKEWMKRIDSDIKERNLPADKTIKELFDVAGVISCDEYVDSAYKRYRIGNPPGKDNKYGDAINWECLLHNVPIEEDLFFISADKDYRSELYDEDFNPFLKIEWSEKKSSHLFFYKNLVPFLNEHFKDIQLKTEEEKQELIEKLKNSPNFITTHGIIAMLDKHIGWTDAQIEDLCAAAEENTQIRWILDDKDVRDFYAKLLSNINVDSLNDCATRRVLDEIQMRKPRIDQEKAAEAIAEMNDALEDYYRH